MTENAEFAVTQAGYTITARVTRESRDLLIEIIGGDVPHYGVVTTVQANGDEQTIALPSRPGHHHEEGALTRSIAKIIKPVLENNAIIVSGMHVNAITPVQMRAAGKMTRQLGEQIRAWITVHPTAEITERFAPGKNHNH